MMPSTMSRSDEEVLLAIFNPSFVFSIEFVIKSLISFDADALSAARWRTSSATTAKPLPASPTRAASTLAFNANIFV